MNQEMFFRIRLYFTGIVTLAISALLAWNHYHGGIPSHHILHREDLPSISNWWGVLILPLLTWFLLYRVQKRVIRYGQSPMTKYPVNVLYGFAGGLFFGILLSVFFTFGYPQLSSYMLMGLLLVALFFPIYRAEELLGFVIGMTFTFGAFLPTVFGAFIVLVSIALYLFVRPVFLYVAAFVRTLSSNKHESQR